MSYPPVRSPARLVVAGFGMVGYRFVERLAALDAIRRYDVTVIGEEPHPAYDRVRLTGCGGDSANGRDEPGRISPQAMADALHTVIESDRTVYARHVVNRLQDEEAVILASEHWRDEKALPLPAQMFRMGAELAAEKTDGFRYALLSKWPVNAQNAPKTDMEAAGLDAVAADPSQPFYGSETLGGIEYFTAVYADVAVENACVNCHNAHADSPRDDFEVGDTMGGVVIRIPLR